ncbi:slit 1 protein [Trichonephila inaurata madagascariensis]|uniref:Slit 1 protein n=1 Tax=Trichonephila inaurata madagascariensis TaxID=2747483 RepID=A0A8X6XL07_9ARAC|nr:slit 1 protein [Trichonephila inaurata madagascariensis]
MLFSNLSKRTDSKAPINSNLGSVKGFKGTILFLDNKSNFWCKAKRENYWSEFLADPFNSYLSAADAQFLGVRFTRDVIGRLALPNFTVLSLPISTPTITTETLGGFLGGAVIVQNLKGSLCIIVLLFYFICLWNQAVGLCPAHYECNDEILRVLCDSANLDVIPITLNPELRELRLSNNNIKAIRPSFSVYRNLEFLDVSHNQLPILDKDNFVDLKELKVLLVNSNMISLLQNNIFKGLHSLKVLHLNENYLQALPAKCFVQLENLELLDLCQNSISSIDQEAFFGLKNLKTLLLRDNKLTHIPSTPFQYISKLFKLDLRLDSFENIPENSFPADAP